MSTTTSGRRITPRAFNTVFHGVLSTSRTAADTEVPTRRSRNKALFSPVWVMTSPSGRCDQRWARGDEQGRDGYDPGEEGHEQPNPLDIEPHRNG